MKLTAVLGVCLAAFGCSQNNSGNPPAVDGGARDAAVAADAATAPGPVYAFTGSSDGQIRAFLVDVAAGTLTPRGATAAGSNPSFLAVDTKNARVFAAALDRHEAGAQVVRRGGAPRGVDRFVFDEQHATCIGAAMHRLVHGPHVREHRLERRTTEILDFEEYTWLYEESWSEPLIRWLLSTVSVSMLWDDHDMSDDWNISHSWLEEMRQRSWWHRRAVDCITSYWVYQHLGNLSPPELAEEASDSGFLRSLGVVSPGGASPHSATRACW